ncbi:tripartite tricarboxylate transporter permease [Oceaniovalibus sp. ACAM 378]|uniref:tripartite tricarboxylate transporter permease n=1 Tax=Oceaniovalibus sp. ACAM 378 TaxID=2599923 RepID=UPI00165264E1
MVTTLDGYPMARKGQAGRALGWALVGSVVGGITGWIALVTFAPVLAKLALKLGSAEYAALAFFGLTIVVSLSGGMLVRGILCAFIGIAISIVGLDPTTGADRWTFGTINLFQGISILPALIGLFAIPEIVFAMAGPQMRVAGSSNLKGMLPPWSEIVSRKWQLLRSSVIGVGVGIVPALGGNIGSLLAYDQERRIDPEGKNYGKGEVGGVIASEAANNGVTGGALIPLLTVGIPGDSVTAMLIGGLMIHGLQPGPQLFASSSGVIYAVLAAFLLANLMMFFISIVGYRYVVRILNVPKHLLYPALLLTTVVGTYALNKQIFDVGVMLVLGVVGVIATLARFPVYPIVLGLVLGPILESEARRALLISGGDWSVFLSRPVSALLIGLAVVALFGPVVMKFLKRRTKVAESVS